MKKDAIVDFMEFIEVFLVAVVLVLLCPIWLPIHIVYKLYKGY